MILKRLFGHSNVKIASEIIIRVGISTDDEFTTLTPALVHCNQKRTCLWVIWFCFHCTHILENILESRSSVLSLSGCNVNSTILYAYKDSMNWIATFK